MTISVSAEWRPIEDHLPDNREPIIAIHRMYGPMTIKWTPEALEGCPWVTAAMDHAWPTEAFSYFIPLTVLPDEPEDSRERIMPPGASYVERGSFD